MEMRELNEQETALIKEYEQHKAAVKVQEKIANDVIRSVFEEFEEDFNNLNWKEHYIITRSWDDTSYEADNPYSVSYKMKQMFREFIKVKFRDGKRNKITFKDYDEVKRITENLFRLMKSLTADDGASNG